MAQQCPRRAPVLEQLPELTSATSLVSVTLSGRALRNMDALGASSQLTSLRIEGNGLLEVGPDLPMLEEADIILIVGNRALTDLSGFGALRSASELRVEMNPSLVRLDLPQLTSGGKLIIRGNEALDDTPLAPFRELPFEAVKIHSNLSSWAPPATCTWLTDGECDERNGGCAPGTDEVDCRLPRD